MNDFYFCSLVCIRVVIKLRKMVNETLISELSIYYTESSTISYNDLLNDILLSLRGRKVGPYKQKTNDIELTF